MSQSLAHSSRAVMRCAHARPTTTVMPPLLQRMFLSTTPSTASREQASTSASKAPIPATGAPLPFRIGRSNSLNFPVYHRIKSGGTNRTTEVKKVEGDARVLSQQLATELSLETKINPRTNHVIVKVGGAAVPMAG
ncbi:hypothetical protein SPBR_06264 [Sporothrix brasiliensis 5110]|uniref:Large ribosomal subunit protein mL49 n=1 Tax=Sporothrix brasiliensis 5110 TaxID=1398154 RepID=A0A0C2IXK5_9PEZI|nr:uncharacterized protein SPBR_06264 [Sporothrix brasiliensis 5110]KIH93861.1 hypothetical protein SPBR_06264 [Sporothrix brasiliensis 5110]